jgi:hypothetical protein
MELTIKSILCGAVIYFEYSARVISPILLLTPLRGEFYKGFDNLGEVGAQHFPSVLGKTARTFSSAFW